jgi:hypothetical protein
LRLPDTIEIGFFTDFDGFKILQKELAIRRLFVFALFVDKPYDIEPVLLAVVPNAKDSPNICLPTGSFGVTPVEAEDRSGRYDLRQSSFFARRRPSNVFVWLHFVLLEAGYKGVLAGEQVAL